jgi:hypothetical protein
VNALPHLASDFFAWLWYTSEQSGGQIDLDGQSIRIWVDDLLAFRSPGQDSSRAVLTGDDAPRGAEARAALVSGKVLRELRLRVDHDDREYALTLRAPDLDIAGLVLPPHAAEAEDEAATLHARMESFEAIWSLVTRLYRSFAAVRTSDAWRDDVVPDLVGWLTEAP